LANPTNPSSEDSESSGGWTDGDLGSSPETPAAKTRALGLASTAFGVGAQPAAPAPLADAGADDDPVESLFRADQTLRAPSIPAAPSEAEVTRWRATVRSSSMFDEQVSDPMPGEDEPLRAPPQPMGNNLELSIDPRIAARARARAQALAAAVAPVQVPPAAGAAGDAGAPPRRRAPGAPGAEAPPPPAAARRGKEATGRSGVRSKAEAAADLAPEAPAAQPGEPRASGEEASELTSARRRRLERGPRPALLAVLGVAALMAFGTAAVLIGLVPNPFADAPPATAAAPRATVPAAAAPRAVKPDAPAKAQAPAVPVAPQPAVPLSPQPAAVTPAAAQAPAAVPADAKLASEQASAAAAESPPAKPAIGVVDTKQEPMVIAPEEAAQQPAAKPRAAAPAASAEIASSSSLLTAARNFLADDEPARAEAAMRELLARDPSDHHAMEMLVRALMDQDRGAEALPFARKMVQRRTKRVPYRLLLGDVLLMVGDEAGARAEWQAALALAPDDREIRRRLGL